MLQHRFNPARIGHQIAGAIGQVKQQRRVDHVAKIDDPGHRPIGTQDQVLLMQIAMDYLRAQAGKTWHDIGHKMVEQCAKPLLLGHWQCVQCPGQPTDQPHVPQQPAPTGRGIKKPTQGPAQLRQCSPDQLQTGRGAGAVAGEGARQKRQHIDQVPRHVDHRRTGQAVADPWDGQAWIDLRDMGKCRDLGRDDCGILGGIGNLDHPGLPGFFLQQAVLIAFAVQRGQRAVQAEMECGNVLHISDRKTRGIGSQELHAQLSAGARSVGQGHDVAAGTRGRRCGPP